MKNTVISSGVSIALWVLGFFVTKDTLQNNMSNIVMIVIVGGLGGWIVYLLMNSKKKKNEYNLKINNLQTQIYEKESKITDLEKADYNYIISCMPEKIQPYAKTRYNEFEELMKVHNKGRTGGLSKKEYYNILNENTKKMQQGDKIWACSTCMDNEWDVNDPDELVLTDNFKEADKRRVESHRLFIFLNKDLLLPRTTEPKSFEKLRDLIPFLKDNEYPNTKSFAIGKADHDNLREADRKLLWKGFCAFDKDTETFFTYDIPRETMNANLGFGEVLVDNTEIGRIKEVFNSVIKGKTLREFIFSKNKNGIYANINQDAADFLKQNGINDPQP